MEGKKTNQRASCPAPSHSPRLPSLAGESACQFNHQALLTGVFHSAGLVNGSGHVQTRPQEGSIHLFSSPRHLILPDKVLREIQQSPALSITMGSCVSALSPWQESYDQPRQHIKKQRHYFANKFRLVKGMVFPVVMYGCESWTIKKAERRRIDAFALWCWRRFLRVPCTTRRSTSPS